MTIPGTEGQTLTGDAAEIRELVGRYNVIKAKGMKNKLYFDNFSAIDSSAVMGYIQEIADLFYDGEIPFEFGRTTPFDKETMRDNYLSGNYEEVGWNVSIGPEETQSIAIHSKIFGGQIGASSSTGFKKELEGRLNGRGDVSLRVPSMMNPIASEPTEKDRAYHNHLNEIEQAVELHGVEDFYSGFNYHISQSVNKKHARKNSVKKFLKSQKKPPLSNNRIETFK
jgi:hypothetical protein